MDTDQSKKIYEAFKTTLQMLPIDIQLRICFYAIDELTKRNKESLNKLIAGRVYSGYEPRIERKAWRKWGTECAHYIEFHKRQKEESDSDDENDFDFNDYLLHPYCEFPFCTAFLHTSKQSYLFAHTETVVPYPFVKLTAAILKKETIFFDRIFHNLEAMPIIEPHRSKNITVSMGGIGIRAVRISGTTAYSFRPISSEVELAHRKKANEDCCTIL
jgi:hypothetical protein